MAKKYFAVTGVKRSSLVPHVITDVYINPINSDGTISPKGQLISKKIAIYRLENNDEAFITYQWDYSHPGKWVKGAEVSVIHPNPPKGNKYLRTDKDKTEKDNLTHLIDYSFFEE